LFPPPAQVCSPPKKDMSWTELPEFDDDTITDYSRPSPSIDSNSSDLQNKIDQQNPTLAKIPILDTRKFEQWQFRIQQYLQHEHYTLWEVIEFRDSYEVPKDNVTIGSASDGTGKNKGRTVALTTDDMQKGKNDVKARTTLLLALPDEHQLRKKITIQGTDVAGFDKSKDWSYMENDEENHALIADEEAPTEFALMAKTNAESEVFDNSLCSKAFYSPPKKDLSWIGLPEFADNTVTDYSRPLPVVESTTDDLQNRNPSVTKTGASPSTIISKPFIKFVKAADRPIENKTDRGVKMGRSSPKNNYTHRMRSQFRAPWVPTVNKNFPTVNRNFPTVNRNFPTGSTKFSTADMGKKGNVVKASAAVPKTTLMTKAIGTVADLGT
nr:hypothetical protein [Tanacetum cinerariifolium]